MPASTEFLNSFQGEIQSTMVKVLVTERTRGRKRKRLDHSELGAQSDEERATRNERRGTSDEERAQDASVRGQFARDECAIAVVIRVKMTVEAEPSDSRDKRQGDDRERDQRTRVGMPRTREPPKPSN